MSSSLAIVSEPGARRFGRLRARQPKLPTERDWERAVLLEPRPAGRSPELISDGGGLPFPPAALDGSLARLDPEDPAVGALIAQLGAQQGLEGWGLLARTDDEALFARGRPPQLVTVAVQRDARRRTWTCAATSAARPLRATRDGIRASGWRLDPTREPMPEDTVLRVLVTEQTYSGGQRADRRLQAPDLHISADELVITIYVDPVRGFKTRTPNPETLARVALPGPVASRQVIDGALWP
jgi:hypothetical protein